MNGVADSSSLNKPIKINLNICTYILYFLYFYILYFIYFFGAGPSSAHMGWAGPSQPGPVTGPSQ
jgi:hypothetical protein